MNSRELTTKDIKIMPIGLVFLYFGVPSVGFVFCFYILMPLLTNIGILPYYSYFISMGFAMVALLIASFVFYRHENNPWKVKAFCRRFRIHKMNKTDWILLLIMLAYSFVVYFFIFPLLDKLIIGGIIPIPKSVPDWLNPSITGNTDELFNQAVGGIKGNWTAFVVFLVGLIFNIAGEEFWWRGYILPREEITFGKNAWVLHGILWAFFHIYKYWDIPVLIILHLPFSYMVYRTKNTTTGILAHFVANGIQIIGIIMLIKA